MITQQEDLFYKFRTNSYKPEDRSVFDNDLSDALQSIGSTNSKQGAYAELISSFSKLQKTGIDPTKLKNLSYLFNTTSPKDLAAEKSSMSGISKNLSDLENTLGLAPISDKKRANILQSQSYLNDRQDLLETDSEEDKIKKERFNDRLARALLLKERFSRVLNVS